MQWILEAIFYGGGGQPDFFRFFPIFSDADFGNSKGGSEKTGINRKKSEKTKNDPIIPAVVCSYTLKCYIFITLIYYQCKVNKIWHF